MLWLMQIIQWLEEFLSVKSKKLELFVFFLQEILLWLISQENWQLAITNSESEKSFVPNSATDVDLIWCIFQASSFRPISILLPSQFHTSIAIPSYFHSRSILIPSYFHSNSILFPSYFHSSSILIPSYWVLLFSTSCSPPISCWSMEDKTETFRRLYSIRHLELG